MKKNLLIAMTGSVAVELHEKILKKFQEKYNVKVMVTESARKLASVENDDGMFDIYYNDKDEYNEYHNRDIVLHIELAKWADKLVVCPASANTIAKVVNGIADNLVTSTILAYTKPIYFVPAMNTNMFLNKITKKNMERMQTKGGHVMVWPTVKKLACGDYGIGAMADLNAIFDIVDGYGWHFPLQHHVSTPNGYPHLGAFGAIRKFDIHTGIDIYCKDEEWVYAVEDGEVVEIGTFTGEKVGTNWWNNTCYIMVKGRSGIVCYGEIEVCKKLKCGDEINRGEFVGKVVAVLPESKIRKDIEGHSNAMLHLDVCLFG